MAAEATTPTGGVSDVGDTWLIGVEVRDDAVDDGARDLVDATVAVTVTKPDDSTVSLAVNHDGPGEYSAGYVITGPGRHFAVASVSGDVVSVVTFATTALAAGDPPTVTDVRTFLGEDGAKYADAELGEVLEAELELQAEQCDVPAVFPTWARRAVFRRVHRALAVKRLPVAASTGDAGAAPVFLSRYDGEIDRLEGPYRVVAFG